MIGEGPAIWEHIGEIIEAGIGLVGFLFSPSVSSYRCGSSDTGMALVLGYHVSFSDHTFICSLICIKQTSHSQATAAVSY